MDQPNMSRRGIDFLSWASFIVSWAFPISCILFFLYLATDCTTNSLGLFPSLILLASVIGIFFGLLAILLGVIAGRKAKEINTKNWAATAGIIIGCLDIATPILFLLFALGRFIY
jgi:hypothetical protein